MSWCVHDPSDTHLPQSASNHAMFASEVIDKSTVLGAGDDDPADFSFADGANVAVISGCTVCLADVASCRQRFLRLVKR